MEWEFGLIITFALDLSCEKGTIAFPDSAAIRIVVAFWDVCG